MRFQLVIASVFFVSANVFAGDNGSTFKCESADKTAQLSVRTMQVYEDEDVPTNEYFDEIVITAKGQRPILFSHGLFTHVFFSENGTTTVVDVNTKQVLLAYKNVPLKSKKRGYETKIEILTSQTISLPEFMYCTTDLNPI